jgi:hypothetical protein
MFRSMRPFRLEGEFFYANREDVNILFFSAWERNLRMRFKPQIIIGVGAHRIFIEGYREVWDFLDIIQPNLPRRFTNASMKGDTLRLMGEEWRPFEKDLQDFITESECEVFAFRCSARGNPLTGRDMNMESLDAAKKPKRIIAFLKRNKELTKCLGDVFPLRLYYRDKEGVECVDGFICGDYPHLTVVRFPNGLRHQPHICTVAYYPKSLDTRPEPAKLTCSAKEALEEAVRRVEMSCNSGWVSHPYEGFEAGVGMLTRERDSIEVMRGEKVNSFYATEKIQKE